MEKAAEKERRQQVLRYEMMCVRQSLARGAETTYVYQALHACNRDAPLSVYLVQEKQRAKRGEEEKTERAAAATKEMKDKEAKEKTNHVCGKCSGAFKSAHGLKVHMSKAHSKDKAEEEEEEVPETQFEQDGELRGSSPDRAMSQTLPSFKGGRVHSCVLVLAPEPRC